MLPNNIKNSNSHDLHTEITALSPWLSTEDLTAFFCYTMASLFKIGTAVFYVSQAVVSPKCLFKITKK